MFFHQTVRKQLQKTVVGRRPDRGLERAVRDLVDESVAAGGVVDIFDAAGLPRADVSILDEEFLQTFPGQPRQNLRLKLLARLLSDEIARRERSNLAKARSFRELLEKTLAKYHGRLIDAAAVVRAMLEIRKDMQRDDERAAALALDPEELAFYDAVAAQFEKIYSVDLLRDLVHDVVAAVKGNLQVDWTEPHREEVKAAVRAAVRRALRRKGVKTEDLEPLLLKVMEQAEALYADWPIAA